MTTAQEIAPRSTGSKASRPALTPYRNVLFFPSQPQLLKRKPVASLYAAIIQAPCSRWTKPWRHQRTILLFAESARAMRKRLETEGRVAPRCFVLQIFRVKGDPVPRKRGKANSTQRRRP